MLREKAPKPLVLVVDDEALIRWSLSEGLVEVGYAVRLASTGAEARAAVVDCGSAPLVVLLDLSLPDVDDLSLLRHIRTARPDAPVLMMTAYGTAEHQAEAHRLGALQFVGKPFDVTEMVRLVDEAWATT